MDTMQPELSDIFVRSAQWEQLSPGARAALQGMLQFAMRRHCDWVVEGTAKQLGDWLGAELGIAPAQIVAGLRELDAAGYVRRAPRAGQGFIVSAPVVER